MRYLSSYNATDWASHNTPQIEMADTAHIRRPVASQTLSLLVRLCASGPGRGPRWRGWSQVVAQTSAWTHVAAQRGALVKRMPCMPEGEWREASRNITRPLCSGRNLWISEEVCMYALKLPGETTPTHCLGHTLTLEGPHPPIGGATPTHFQGNVSH